MPAESTLAVIAVAAGTAALSFVAGASVSPTPEQAQQAVFTAQQMSQITEDATFYYSIGGGIGGAFVALAFGLYSGTWQQMALRLLGSAVCGCFAGPAMISLLGWQQSRQVILPVSGAVGLLAYGLVMAIAPDAITWIKMRIRRMFGVQGKREPKTEQLES